MFIISSVTPMVVGYNVRISDITEKQDTTKSDGPMDSAWPMKCHDLHHTSRSPYSTASNPGVEKWRYRTSWQIEGGIVIVNDGTIYFGCFDRYLYAVYPNGTLKWKYKTGGWIWSTPAISEDGTIYVGSWDDYLYAINPDGTEKWKFLADDCSSSSAIAEDGTIYFGVMGPGNNGRIYALYPNGTEKWHYDTGYWIVSDPAIGDDGTVYIGSGDSYLYALWPDGTLRWRFKTGDEIHGHPSIAEDGTIYIASFDHKLYALNPNGTEKWKRDSGYSGCSSVAVGEDGTLYFDSLYAAYPNNGTTKWHMNLGSNVDHSSLAISADGTIYVGAGKYIIAVDCNGNEIWRKKIANKWVESSPAIGEDGTVYIGSSSDDAGYSYGYLHAFGPQETNDPPTAPSITGPTTGKAGTSYDYKFVATDPDRNPVSYYVKWGDDTHTGWTDDYNTGEEITLSHAWSSDGTFTIKAKARDTFGAEGPEASLTVTMPRNRAVNNLFLKFLQQHSHKFPIIWHILGL